MKLREIVLGSALATGILTGCASPYKPFSHEEWEKSQKYQGIRYPLSSGPYSGFYNRLKIEKISGKRTVWIGSVDLKNSGFLEVVFESENSEGTVIRNEGNIKYYPEEVRKLAGLPLN